MKESTNKTAGRTQTGQNKSATKSSRTTTSHASSTSRGSIPSGSRLLSADRPADLQGIHAAGSSGNRAGTDFAHTIRNG